MTVRSGRRARAMDQAVLRALWRERHRSSHGILGIRRSSAIREPRTVIGREAIHSVLSEIVHNWVKEPQTLLNPSICQIDGERFLEQRIYVDMSPVFAPPSLASGLGS
jgi:hypothetical protein